MPRDVHLYLRDIATAIERTLGYCAGLDRGGFEADMRTVDAVCRNLEVLGEAAKKVPEEFRSAHPEIEWRKLAGMRDVLAHDYFQVDLDVVWDVVQNKLPELRHRIGRLLDDVR
ncbi:MAG: DUF86 domain-containing protein [Planctomycetes bacterium]|nr:DUF86 domain-containing protein [Planctomycetota bacterium]